MAANTYTQTNTIQGTSEEIGALVLRWAGLEEMWEQHDLGRDFNAATDLVEVCAGLSVDTDDWDADRPMYSEINYTVWIRDPEKAKADMLKHIWELISRREKARR